MIAACGAVIHGGGNIPRYHDFRVCLTLSLKFAVQGLVRITVEPQIPVKSILGYHDLHHEGFNDRFRNILPFVDVGVPEAEAKRIEEDALNYLRGCFHVDGVNAFYELRPEAETQKALARESYEALFDNLDGNYIDSLLAQFEEDD